MAKKKKKTGGGKRKVFAGVKRTDAAPIAPAAKNLPVASGDLVTPLSKDEKATADKLYYEQIKLLKNEETDTLEKMLLLYWKYGQFAADLFNDPRKYGNRVAEDLGRDLQLHPDTIRAYHRFYMQYTLEKVKESAREGMRWRAIESLIKVRDPKQRAKLEGRVAAKQLSSEELREAVKEANEDTREKAKKKGEKVDRRGGLHDAAAFRNCSNTCAEMSRKLDQYMDACINLKTMEDEERAKKLAALKAGTKEDLKKIAAKLQRALKS